MKKSLYLLLIGSLFWLTGCFNDEYSSIPYKEDPRNEVSPNYTYKFVGKSEHFYFQTGKVFYGDTSKELLLSNFNLKKEMKKSLKYSINISFDGKLFYGNYPNIAKKEQQQFKDSIISVAENNCTSEDLKLQFVE